MEDHANNLTSNVGTPLYMAVRYRMHKINIKK